MESLRQWAEVCPAGVTRDLKLTRPLGQGLENSHVVINEVYFKIFLRDYMWNDLKEFSFQGRLKWWLHLGLNDFWPILSKTLSSFLSPPFQKPDREAKLTESTQSPTPWGKYTRKTKANAENECCNWDPYWWNRSPRPNTVAVDFVSNLRVKIRIHYKNANVSEVPV